MDTMVCKKVTTHQELHEILELQLQNIPSPISEEEK